MDRKTTNEKFPPPVRLTRVNSAKNPTFFHPHKSASLPSSSANLAVQCTGQLIENAGAASCKTIHWTPLHSSLPSSGRYRLCWTRLRDSRVRRIWESANKKKNQEKTSFFLFSAPPPFSPAFLFRIFHTLEEQATAGLNW